MFLVVNCFQAFASRDEGGVGGGAEESIGAISERVGAIEGYNEKSPRIRGGRFDYNRADTADNERRTQTKPRRCLENATHQLWASPPGPFFLSPSIFS